MLERNLREKESRTNRFAVCLFAMSCKQLFCLALFRLILPALATVKGVKYISLLIEKLFPSPTSLHVNYHETFPHLRLIPFVSSPSHFGFRHKHDTQKSLSPHGIWEIKLNANCRESVLNWIWRIFTVRMFGVILLFIQHSETIISSLFISSHIWKLTFFGFSTWLTTECSNGVECILGFMDCVIIHSKHDSDTNYLWFLLIRFTNHWTLYFPKELT